MAVSANGGVAVERKVTVNASIDALAVLANGGVAVERKVTAHAHQLTRWRSLRTEAYP